MLIELQEIITFIDAQCFGDAKLKIMGLNSLKNATADELAFFAAQSYSEQLRQTKAKAIIISKDIQIKDIDIDKTWILVADPKLAFFKIQEKFYPQKQYSRNIAPQATIDTTAKIGKDTSIYPFVYIDKNAQIGDHSVIYSHSFIGENVKIGKNCLIYPNCSILDKVIIGDNVTIHSGSVLGSDGFGYITKEKKHHKIFHKGSVTIDNYVEIGANCTIDRGTIENTVIGKGTKIDNLVHIAHNVKIGAQCLIAAQVGIAGSTHLGDNVYCGGQVGILGHNKIEDGSIFYPRSCFMQERKTLPANSHMSGVPAIPIQEWRKNIVVQKKLALLEKRLRTLEAKNSS